MGNRDTRSRAQYLLLSSVLTVALGASAVRRVSRVVVVGASMHPALHDGDHLLVVRGARLRPGNVVVVDDPRDPHRSLVKRVVEITPGGVTVAGDDPGASTDSRHFGPVPPAAVRGRAVYLYHPGARRVRL